MYIVEKKGIYLHGVFWIGNDLEEAKKKADEFASHDPDDYHHWVVSEFKEIAVSSVNSDPEHNKVYTTRKGIT